MVLVPSDSERTNRLMVSPALVNLKEVVMKIVVIGGTGLIGSRLVANLHGRTGTKLLAASPQSGVNSVTGDGLAWTRCKALRRSSTSRTPLRGRTLKC